MDIGPINKYYDLSKLGDALAAEHYLTLEKTASDCVQCGATATADARSM